MELKGTVTIISTKVNPAIILKPHEVLKRGAYPEDLKEILEEIKKELKTLP